MIERADPGLTAAPAALVRKRFWVTGERSVWLVAEGGIDLFLQRQDADGEPMGPRHHVLRVPPSQMFVGDGAEGLPDGFSLLAVPLPGAHVHRVAADIFVRAEHAEQAVALCNDWASATTRAMLKPAAPRVVESIERGAVVAAEADRVLRAAERVIWIEIDEGNALWMERYDCVVNRASGPAPLPRDLWIKAAGVLRARAVDPATLLADARIFSALGLHQRFILGWMIGAIERAVEREQARLESKAQQSVILTNEALRRLLSVTTGDKALELEHRRNACLAACQILGENAGIEFRMPQAADLAAMDRDPVAAVAAASKVRYRRVALKGEWWSGDNGPLLVAYANGSGWVALLRKRDGYVLRDPGSDATLPITEEMATRLKPFGYMFYRPLPKHVLRLRDIGAFLVRGQGVDVAIVFALGALGGLLGMALPLATGILVDTLIPSADVASIWQMVAALVVIAVAASLFEVMRSIAILRVESKMDSSLQAAIWDRVLNLPVPYFRNFSAGDLALRINGVNTIRRALSRTTVSALFAGLFSIFNFLLLFYYSPVLAGVAAGLILLAMLFTLAIGAIKLHYERRLSEAGGKLSSLIFQYLQGIAKLRVGSAEGRAFANWTQSFSRYRALQFRAQHWGNVQHTILTGYSTLATATIFAVIGMWLTRASGLQLSTGEFIAFSAAFGGFFAGMIGLAETLLDVLNLVPIYERARPILETLPEADEGKAHPGELQGGIELAGVSFRYPDGPEIIKEVSLSVRAGGYIALVGPSGSGKSTLLRLLLGFETPTAGAIYYDNQDLATLDVQALRRQIGVVLQNGQLIAGDVFSNIIGASMLTLDDAWEAARMVGLDEDIDQMPMGMHTVIGEGVSTLSGGQRQRILIARAVVHRPRILFFDEATSALDNRTQAIVMRTLEKMKTTRVVIAHRLSTIVNADRIVVLKDGQIVQIGNYQTLIAQPGMFADLARRQIA